MEEPTLQQSTRNTCWALLIVATLLCAPAAAIAAKKVDAAKLEQLHKAGVQALRDKNFDVAEKSLEKAFEIAQHLNATDPRHKAALHSLVRLYIIQRQWAAAEPWAEKLVVLSVQSSGKGHVNVSQSLATVAQIYLHLKKFEKAEAAYLRALKIRATSKNHSGWALKNNLAETYRRWNKPDKAIVLYREVIVLKEAKLGKTHPELATTLNDLALLFMRAKKHSEAKPLLERAHGLSSKLAKRNLRAVGKIKNNLANCYKTLGKHADAEKLYIEAIGIAKASKPVDTPGIGNSYYNLANLYAFTKRDEKAATAYREAIKARKLEYGSKHPRVKKTELALANVLDRLGKPAAAATLRANHK